MISGTNRSIDYTSSADRPSQDPDSTKLGRQSRSRGSSTCSQRKIYGQLSQRQKNAIRESNQKLKKVKIIKKPQSMRFGADWQGKKPKVSPYAIDQEQNLLNQSSVPTDKAPSVERPRSRATLPLGCIDRELKI